LSSLSEKLDCLSAATSCDPALQAFCESDKYLSMSLIIKIHASHDINSGSLLYHWISLLKFYETTRIAQARFTPAWIKVLILVEISLIN
jgi:hypothetical protein